MQWVTVPIGLAALAVVEIARWPRKAGDYSPASRAALLPLEFSGVAFICGAALVESITAGALYALIAVLWGLLIALWAVLTRVRRRLLMGVAIASLGLFLLVGVPVAQLVPQITGVTLWAALAGLGALSLLVATTIEQSRARIGIALRRLDELTEVWE